MGFKCGIVGLPNVGKSTLFNALTNSEIGAENYPFCTIDPNVGVVPLPDPRIDAIAAIAQPKQTIPAHMEFVDIAGLVKGASKGEGLGNQFLSHICETQAIAQVVRCFDDENIIHVAGKVNPLEDIEVINTELCLADQETVDKALHKTLKIAKNGDESARKKQIELEAVATHLDQGNPARTFEGDLPESIRCLHLLTSKPCFYIANLEEERLFDSPWIAALQELVEKEGSEVIPVCAAIESELSELSADEKIEFLKDLGLEEPGLNRVVRVGYRVLGLQTYFTAGPKEVRAWTIPVGSTAKQASGAIHTDFERGFIRAEVTAYDDYIRYKGEQGAKNAGKWRLEGKDYIVRNGDIMLFRFNV